MNAGPSVCPLLLAGVILLSSPAVQAQEQTRQAITISAVGDIMMGTTYPQDLLPPDDGNGIFRDAVPAFAGSDIVLGNLEGPLVDGGVTEKCVNPVSICFAFRTPTRYVKHLSDAGFTALHIANNHANDFGRNGLESSLGALAAAGIQPVGGKAVARFDIGGTRVAAAGFSYASSPYSFSLLDVAAARSIIRELSRGCDLLIISFHGGAEGAAARHIPDRGEQFLGEERGNVKEFAHAAVDAGADLVVGHGPHVLRAMELYRGKLIAYSLGNFLTYARFNIKGPTGLTVVLRARLDAATGDLVDAELVPFRLAGEGIPTADPERKAVLSVRNLMRQDFARPGIDISSTGKVTVRKNEERAVAGGGGRRGPVPDTGEARVRTR